MMNYTNVARTIRMWHVLEILTMHVPRVNKLPTLVQTSFQLWCNNSITIVAQLAIYMG